MNVLILGARGRLAAALAREWSSRHVVTRLARPDVDVANLAGLEKRLAQIPFDVLVNGTGMTNVDACETEREAAATVNAHAPAVMARAATARGARFIHFSTDYVFDGNATEPYTEDAPAHPLGWYGKTKRAGEDAALAANPASLVVRVSWVFGPDKPGFVDMILDQARTRPHVAAVADKFSSPTSACDVAAWLEPFFTPALPGGLLHACNSGTCSWRDYGAHALECAAAAGVPLATTTVEPLALADMKMFAAPRPVFSTLSTEKLTRLTGITPRPWQDALRDYVEKKYASIPSAT